LEKGLEEGLEKGLEEGLEEGLEKGRLEGKRIGKLVGVIQTLQQLLGDEVPPPEDLEVQPEKDLALLVETLQARLRERGVS
jgi:flagellar biosynthesis/type III secretory pathway protein FliH